MLIIFFKKNKTTYKKSDFFFKMIKSIFFFEFKFLFREKIKKKKQTWAITLFVRKI
jgi:hypothetical protein